VASTSASTSPIDIDYERAFSMYVERFDQKFGVRDPGAFVKFGKHMVTRLSESEFKTRLDDYVRLHKACKKMIETGSTISDALVLDFVEAAAWVAVEAPNIHAMFSGEMGDPRDAAPARGQGDELAATQRLKPPIG